MKMENKNTKRALPPRAQILVWGGLVGLLVLVGAGLKRSQQGTIQPGDKIPDFSLALYSGYEYNGLAAIQLADLHGKVVAVNFWASWCKPCEQEAASLEGAWSYYQPGGKVVFVGVDYVIEKTRLIRGTVRSIVPNLFAPGHPPFALKVKFLLPKSRSDIALSKFVIQTYRSLI